MNILAFGTHPDDIEFSCGGTLLKHRNRDDRIRLVVLTTGLSEEERRRKEQDDAAAILRAELQWGNYRDTEIPVGKELITFLEAQITDFAADEVYFTCDHDTHQDHRALAQACLAASRYVQRVLMYEGYTALGFEPDVFVDIGDVLNEKVQLLCCHQSQILKANPANMNMQESVYAVAAYRGFQAKVRYAEGFKAVRLLRNL